MVFISLVDELRIRGYKHKKVALGKKNLDAFSSPNDMITVYRGNGWTYPFVSFFAQETSRDKLLSYDLAESLGVSIPKTLCTDNPSKAILFMNSCDSVIVKPSESRASNGLTRDLVDEDLLSVAFKRALSYGGVPIIQEQFIGEEVRLTVVSGKVRSVIMKRKLAVVGNGIDTIRDLVLLENDTRSKLPDKKIVYPKITNSMISDKIDIKYVPLMDEVIELSKSTLVSKGASLCEIIELIDKSYIYIAEKLASAMNPSFVVVDLMVKDCNAKATDDNYVFLEYNTSPVLSMYGAVREGSPQNIIYQLANLIDLSSGEGNGKI